MGISPKDVSHVALGKNLWVEIHCIPFQATDIVYSLYYI